jgi:multidrug efflux pump subunit AcrB
MPTTISVPMAASALVASVVVPLLAGAATRRRTSRQAETKQNQQYKQAGQLSNLDVPHVVFSLYSVQ